MNDSWYYKNIDHCKTYQKEYRLNNKHIFKAKEAAYRARKINATPNWLDREMKRDIINIYKYCESIMNFSGVPHSVDHIVPLNGINVSGLHVPWNLQVTTSTYNIKKGNKCDFKLDDNNIFKIQYKHTYKVNECCRFFVRKVVRLNDGKIFNSVTLAAKAERCGIPSITRVCSGDRMSINKQFYKYYEDVDNIDTEFELMKNKYLNSSSTSKRVLCIETEIIYNSPKAAAKAVNRSEAMIKRSCITGKTCKKMHFKYIF